MQLDSSTVDNEYVANHRANGGPAATPVVATDPARGRKVFMTAIDLPLEKYGADAYYASESIPSSKHFGEWPLWQAAEAG